MKLIENSERVLVALSGGIDSAATVLMLQEQGFVVTALYIDMLGDEDSIKKTSQTAKLLGVELIVENVADEFRAQVIDYTLAEHRAGRTPSPCVECNPLIKWAVTERVADRLSIYHIATGHYVRIVDGGIVRGVDPTKDQSYYLWMLTPDTLHRAITPLGDFTKAQVRQYLGQHPGFENLASGGESMSICFLMGGSYGDFLKTNLDVTPGKVLTTDGCVVGQHDGYELYTIGQKRGFSGGGTVTRVDPEHNHVIVSDDPTILYTSTVRIRDWVIHPLSEVVASCGSTALEDSLNSLSERSIHIKVRGLGRNPLAPLTALRLRHDNTLELTLPTDIEAPQHNQAWAVASGQPVVLYDGYRVIGGGIAI